MRKLILASALILLSTSAFAGPRGLSSPQPAQSQAVEQQSPIRKAEVTVLPGPAEQPAVTVPPPSMEEKLKAAGEIKPDSTLATQTVTRIQTLAPVQAQPAPAPVQAQPAPAPVQAAAPAAAPAKRVSQAQPSHKPVTRRVAHRGESNERKARRIAARFGISW